MEENNRKLEVELISTEIIKPTIPTPSVHNSFTLSFLDQNALPFHVPLLLFYTNSTQQQRLLDTNALKKSLAETLCHFYPLAGRVVDGQHVVSCNDQGVPFLETRVNCDLSTFLNSPRKLNLLPMFFPSNYYKPFECRPISEIVQLAFQINVFECGGFALGCYMFHKLLDASSFGNFLRYWSCLANEHYKGELMEPDFATPVITFPPSQKIKPLSTVGIEESILMRIFSPIEDDEIVAKNYKFNKGVIEELRSMAASEELPKATRFEAVAGFIWKHAFAAACTAGNVVPTRVSFTANVRGRINPPLTRASMGNIFTVVTTQADEKRVGFSDLVAKLHAAVSKVKPRIESLKPKIAAAEATPEEWIDNDGGMSPKSCNTRVYMLTSWCNLGFNEVDFGFGKPNWIVPINGEIHPILRNFIILTDCSDPSDDDGVEVWLFLLQKVMLILESDSEFLAYASSN